MTAHCTFLRQRAFSRGFRLTPALSRQLLQSLGYQQSNNVQKRGSILDLRQANAPDDDIEYAEALLAESRDAAIETYGAGSFCVGNVADDPDVEDIAVILEQDDVTHGWEKLVNALKLDLSSVSHLDAPF